MNYFLIGQNIRKTRKVRGLTQEQLAEMVDISVTHLSHIETGGTKLSLQVLIGIASALDISATYLLEGQQQPNDSTLQAITEELASFTPNQKKIILETIRALKQAMNTYK